jgi:hypothetical protein
MLVLLCDSGVRLCGRRAVPKGSIAAHVPSLERKHHEAHEPRSNPSSRPADARTEAWDERADESDRGLLRTMVGAMIMAALIKVTNITRRLLDKDEI